MRMDIPIELMPEQALCILCKTLHMEFVYEEEDTNFYIKENPETGENAVWLDDRIYDDRGDLFIALRNVAVNFIPNLYFRNADYIYSNKGRKQVGNNENISWFNTVGSAVNYYGKTWVRF